MSDQSIDNGPESSSKVNYAIPLLFKNKQSFSIRMKVSKRGIFLIIGTRQKCHEILKRL